ncbi:MAG: amidohydrolase family protein [Alphaproteobacteria bacterium]|nr:amidohydrolase family protein [Alphaproteobacteria bacterium]MDE1985697.1 amidohydrolase family protein [Alphaproteobacteria bacterium]MDE2161890.1 amidohydrolase family protein [Alphaproteobacteria bacterium]MDE2264961.1 amidohydrolase family protein [Alphaproteobacteria bacterium]
MIDAHQHFWRIGENDCTWPPPKLEAIYRDFLPEELEAMARPIGVTGSVLVQSQESDRDTDWLLAQAETTEFVNAVVGWVDLKSPTACARIATLAEHPKMRGLRPMLQGLPSDTWILDPALEPALDVMIANRLSFDALVLPRHLRHLRLFAKHHPDLAIVINHAAKPSIRNGQLDPWREDISALAALPNVLCKISGLLTEASPKWDASALGPYVDHLIRVFGPFRLMWGSDWPVLNLAGGYAQWLELARKLCGGGPVTMRAIFDGTARAFYRL